MVPHPQSAQLLLYRSMCYGLVAHFCNPSTRGRHKPFFLLQLPQEQPRKWRLLAKKDFLERLFPSLKWLQESVEVREV